MFEFFYSRSPFVNSAVISGSFAEGIQLLSKQSVQCQKPLNISFWLVFSGERAHCTSFLLQLKTICLQPLLPSTTIIASLCSLLQLLLLQNNYWRLSDHQLFSSFKVCLKPTFSYWASDSCFCASNNIVSRLGLQADAGKLGQV